MALRLLYGLITKGGGRIDKSPRLLVATPGRIRPIGRAVGVRIFSDVCATGGGEPAVALFSRQLREFTVSPKGAAEQVHL